MGDRTRTLQKKGTKAAAPAIGSSSSSQSHNSSCTSRTFVEKVVSQSGNYSWLLATLAI
jgi:hypothetical protein